MIGDLVPDGDGGRGRCRAPGRPARGLERLGRHVGRRQGLIHERWRPRRPSQGWSCRAFASIVDWPSPAAALTRSRRAGCPNPESEFRSSCPTTPPVPPALLTRRHPPPRRPVKSPAPSPFSPMPRWGPSTRSGTYVPRAIVEDDLGRRLPRRRHRRHHRRVRRRRHRRGHGGQDRQGRGPSRHRLQVRGRHPVARALHPQRHRPRGDRQPRRPHRGARPPEGGQGGPARPVEEAGPVRARLGDDREDQGLRRHREGAGHRSGQGRPDRRHRAARASCPPPWSSCAGSASSSPTSAGASRPRSSSSTATATTSSCPAGPGSRRRRRSSAASSWST